MQEERRNHAKKLATKIASILLSAEMLVSTTMTAFATDGEVSVAAEQTEVQIVAETADDEALEASEEDATASEEIAEEETVAEEEITADEVITEESTTEAAQENVEEAQVLDAEEVQALDAEQVVADENDMALANATGDDDAEDSDAEDGDPESEGFTQLGDSNIWYKYWADENGGYDTLEFRCTGKTGALPKADKAKEAAWYDAAKAKTITEIQIGDGITSIGNSAFMEEGDKAYPKLKTVILSSDVKTIFEFAFQNSTLEELVNDEGEDAISADSIGYRTFYGSNIKKVEISTEKNVSLSSSAFENCKSLTSFVVTGNGSLTLNARSFCGCSNLEVIGNPPEHYTAYNVAYLGTEALSGTKIVDVHFSTESITLEADAFKGVSMNSICYPGTAVKWKAIVDAVEGGVSLDDKWPVKLHCVADEPIGSGYAYCRAGNHYYSAKTNDDPTPETETEHQHSWSAWKTKSPATVFAAEVQERTCKCGETETRTVGKKLTPTITVNAKKIWLQKGQKTSAFRVSGLANGDSVKSYKSSNKKIFTVTNKGVIKAGKKIGKAKLTITLASGKKKVVTVQVQKRQVKTWAIKNLPAKVTIKKGATYTLSPVVSLITSTHKVTYKTSNKKIATVTSAGKIKGVKKGTATITVKSGTITKKVKVTVK